MPFNYKSMVPRAGVEPTLANYLLHTGYKSAVLPLNYRGYLVRLTGLEPVCLAAAGFKPAESTISPQSRLREYIIVFVIVCCGNPCSS